MELGAIIHRARGLVDDRVVPLSSNDGDFILFAARAEREAAERSLCLRAAYTRSTTAGNSTLTIPVADSIPDSIVVQRVYINGVPLAKGSYERVEAALQADTTQDTPRVFSQRGQELLLYPTPDAVVSVLLSGVWYPLDPMTTSESISEIPSYLHDDLAHWLAYEAILSADAGDDRNERRTRLAERQLAMFDRRFGPARSQREIETWRELAQERHVRGPGTV